jgi:hypothetical protein
MHPVLFTAIAELHRTAPLVGARAFPAAWRHGDFKAQNLIATTDGLVVLDSGLRYDEIVVADISKFTSDIEFLSWSIRGWSMRRNRDLLIDNFIVGYISMGAPELEGAILWFRLYDLVRFWSQFEATGKRGLKSRYQRLCFSVSARELCGKLSHYFKKPT